MTPMRPAELAPGAAPGNGAVEGTATDVCVTGAVVGAVDPAGARVVVVGGDPGGIGRETPAKVAGALRPQGKERRGLVHVPLHEHEAEGLQVERAQRRDGRALALGLGQPDGPGPDHPQCLWIRSGGQQPGVLLGVRGIPVVGLGVRDPQTGLIDPLQPDHEVDGGVLPAGQRFVEADQDGPLGNPKLDLRVVGSQFPPKVVAHGLHDRSGSVLVFRVRSEGGMRPAVQHDPGVGVQALVALVDGAVGRAVGQGARGERVPHPIEALGSGSGGVAALACFLEGGVLGCDLGADVVQHLLCEAQGFFLRVREQRTSGAT